MIAKYREDKPAIDPTAFIAPSATVIGAVTISRGASLWFNTVVRGDMAPIFIGEDSNVQDLSMVHVDHNTPTHIGNRVVVGHRAIIHGSTVGDDCIIGMGATVLDKAVIPPNSIVGAGALIPPRKTYHEGSLILGSPGVVARMLSAEEIAHLPGHARDYVALWRAIAAGKIGRV